MKFSFALPLPPEPCRATARRTGSCTGGCTSSPTSLVRTPASTNESSSSHNAESRSPSGFWQRDGRQVRPARAFVRKVPGSWRRALSHSPRCRSSGGRDRRPFRAASGKGQSAALADHPRCPHIAACVRQMILNESPQFGCHHPVVLRYGDVEHRRGQQQELVVARQLPSPRRPLPRPVGRPSVNVEPPPAHPELRGHTTDPHGAGRRWRFDRVVAGDPGSEVRAPFRRSQRQRRSLRHVPTASAGSPSAPRGRTSTSTPRSRRSGRRAPRCSRNRRPSPGARPTARSATPRATSSASRRRDRAR